MVMDLKQYAKLKKHADENQRAVDKQAGLIEGIKAELKKEFGVSSPMSIKSKLKKLTKERDDAESEYNTALERFLETYPDIEGEG